MNRSFSRHAGPFAAIATHEAAARALGRHYETFLECAPLVKGVEILGGSAYRAENVPLSPVSSPLPSL